MRSVPVMLLCLGCGGDDFPPPSTLDAQYTTCETQTDCVAVELGCCDECNGGTAVAARADKADEVVELYAESCPGSVACTEMGCPPWEVSCDNNSCSIQRGTFGS